MGLSNGLSCEAGGSSHSRIPHRLLLPEVMRLYFPCAGTLGCVVCVTPQLFLLVYPQANIGQPAPPAAILSRVLSSLLPISAPPTSLDEKTHTTCLEQQGIVHKYCAFWWDTHLYSTCYVGNLFQLLIVISMNLYENSLRL